MILRDLPPAIPPGLDFPPLPPPSTGWVGWVLDLILWFLPTL